MLSGAVGLQLVERAFVMVAEQQRGERSDAFITQFLRPMAAEHDGAIFGALAEWVSRKASSLEAVDEGGNEQAALNHVLGLLVNAMEECHPTLREEFKQSSEMDGGWIQFFSRKAIR